jgi:hypothetical protein
MPFVPFAPSLPGAPGVTSTEVPSGQEMVATPVAVTFVTVQFPAVPHAVKSDNSGTTHITLRMIPSSRRGSKR